MPPKLRSGRGVLLRSASVGLVACGAVVAAIGAGCFPGSGPGLLSPEDGGGPTSPGLDTTDAAPIKRDVDLGDPFAVEGLTPSHGPWTGGLRSTVRGRGFPTKVRVFLGGLEVPAGDVFASDPTRAAVVIPPGVPGAVDVKIRDDATAQERTLAGGFVYDAFVVEPSSGATSGGTRIALKGSGTAWTTGTTVAIGGKACERPTVVAVDRIECITAAQPAGSQDVTVTTPDGVFVQVRDAYTYSDSPDGYRGGLSGGVLAGSMRVLVLDAYTGVPLAGARAIAGGDVTTAIIAKTDAGGLAQLTSPTLTGKVTITIAAKCHQPVTYADVPVDTVTAYITPVLDPACADGDPPSTGNGTGRSGAQIVGELIWPGGVEFQKAGWTTVPNPARATERRAAYVYVATASPLDAFALPDATVAITPLSEGVRGYAYSLITLPGNLTLYALAGIEDRSVTPPRFTPYVMGLARGASAQAGVQTVGVDIPMASLLDHTVTLAPQPPAAGPRGPDRFQANLAISLATNAFAILPSSAKSRALPLAGTVPFIGVPPLSGALATESYVISASAVTGPSQGAPASVIARFKTTDTSNVLTVAGFLGVPVLSEPSTGKWSGRSLKFTATSTLDLVQATISSAGGLVAWTVIAPGGTREVALPDLASPLLGADPLGLRRGPLQTTLYIARIDSFDYAKLRSGQLSSASWNAYAIDTLNGDY